MAEIEYPATRDALDNLHYRELQPLAAELGFGPIVGAKTGELKDFIDEQLFDETGELLHEYSDQPPDDEQPVEEVEDEPTPKEPRTDGSGSTDAVSVGHDGHEKLSPEGAPDDNSAAVPAPDGVDLDGVSMDELEASATSDPVNEEPEPEESDEQGEEKSGSLLDRIKGDSDRSSDEIVDDAGSEAERQRREDVRDRFEQAMGSPSPTDESVDEEQESSSAVAGAGKTHTPNGLVVDESLVGYLIDMPFNTAASATGWDGWELSAREREANAELFIAMCDEHDVDLSPTVMFALSMGGTASGKALRYKRHRDSQRADVEDIDQQATSAEESDESRRRPALTGQAQTEQRSTDSDGFDFENSEDW